MMLDFSDMKEQDAKGKLPEGKHLVTLTTVGELKANKSGKAGFCMWFEKTPFKPVMQYIQMTDNIFDKRRIMNTLTAFNVKLEQREYKPKEVYAMIKKCEQAQCEVEIMLKDDSFVNDEGEKINFKKREIATLLPTETKATPDPVKEADLEEIDLF